MQVADLQRGRAADGTALAQVDRRAGGTLEHLGDLAADQLVPLDEGVAQRLDEVAVLVEQRAGVGLLLLQDALDPRSGRR